MPKKSPAKKSRGGEPETSSGSMFEKQAMKVKGSRKRMLSRIMMDDSFYGADDIPPQKLSAVLPKKKKAPKAKASEKEKDSETRAAPKAKGGYSSHTLKAIQSVLQKIEETSEEMADDLKKDKKNGKKAAEINKLATAALDQ